MPARVRYRGLRAPYRGERIALRRGAYAVGCCLMAADWTPIESEADRARVIRRSRTPPEPNGVQQPAPRPSRSLVLSGVWGSGDGRPEQGRPRPGMADRAGLSWQDAAC